MPVAFGATGLLIMRSSLREAFAAALATSDVLVTAVFFALGWSWQRYTSYVDSRFIKVELRLVKVEQRLDELERDVKRLQSAQEAAEKHHGA